MPVPRQGMARPRGISNVSGVSCHLSSALQFLLHVVPALRQALTEVDFAKHTHQASWIQELSHLAKELFERNVETSAPPRPPPVDPRRFYDALLASTHGALDANELGDAATALRILLYKLQQQCPALQPLLQHSLLGGRLEQTLMGESIQNETLTRRVKIREKSMACPFAIPVPEDATFLSQAIAKATLKAQSIQNLDWNQVSDYQQEQIVMSEEKSCTDWVCHMTIRLSCLPQHLLLHLQRFRYDTDHSRVEIMASQLDVPLELDMMPYLKDESTFNRTFAFCHEFVGAILHVSHADEVSSGDEEEEEGGHYVALVRTTDSHEVAGWYLLDDEKVTLLPDEKDALDLASGRRPSCIEPEDIYCPTVLAYSKACNSDDTDSTSTLLQELKEELRTVTEKSNSDESGVADVWSEPERLNGKRLRVRWKSGKYYSGVVASYDEESGKHCIEYDDGDVRHYTLRKKTIEWIDGAQ